MRAIQVTRFGGPQVLVASHRPEPVVGEGQVVVDVAAAEVLFLDTQLRGGWGREYFGMEPPFVPGVGVAGTVSSAGAGLDPGWIGRRVVASTGRSGEYVGGGYAERAAVPADGAFEVPAGLDLPEALAAIHDGITALSRANRAAIQPGERVLVSAAGGSLGVWLVPLARAAGAFVVAAARGERKLAHARRLGADVVVDYSEADWTDRVQHAIGGSGIDVVFDGAGGQLGRGAFEITAPGGRFFSYGSASGSSAEIDAREAERRRVQVVGVADPVLAQDWAPLIERALTELAEGRIGPAIGQALPLERAADAHAAIEARVVIGKSLLLT